jgi:hypothetical protein
MDADRNETDAERHDRNWLELVQELRVAQTGIQVLAGFLVRTADRVAKAALAGIGLTLVVVVVLIFDVVVGTGTGVVAGAVLLLFYVLAWVVLPASLARQREAGGR